MNLAKQTTFRALAAAFAIGAVCLLAANHFGALPIPVFGVGDASATEASPEVMDALHAAADAKLAETPGRDQVVDRDGTSVVVGALRIDGEPVTISALQLGTVVLSGASTFIGSAGSTDGQRMGPTWIAVWKREGIEVPGWPDLASLTVRVVLEDQSLAVRSVDIELTGGRGRVAPGAATPAAVAEPVERCVPVDGGPPGARFCSVSAQ